MMTLRMVTVFLLAIWAMVLPLAATEFIAGPAGATTVFQTGTSILAGGANGHILRSTNNGASFVSVRAGSPTDAILCFARSGQVIVAVGRSGVIYLSTNDGVTWAERHGATTAINGDWTGIATNGNQVWVAVGFSSNKVAWAFSTNNGASWTRSTHASNGYLHGVTWHAAGSRFVAVGSDGVFNGLAFTTTNGTSLTALALPSGTAPLHFIASDGSGRLLAGGESSFEGSLLLSTAATPAFTFVPSSFFSETLRSAHSVGPQQWLVGGDDTLLLEASAATGARVLAPARSGGEAIRSLALISGQRYVVAGGVPQLPGSRPPLPRAEISTGPAGLVLTATGTVAGASYALQSSTDLINWAAVPGSIRTATGGVVQWDLFVPPGEGFRSWRVRVE